MSLVNIETGELVEFDRAAAERRAERITMRLDAIAENYSRVLPMIREAIEKRDDIALGYRSPGDYVSDRFGQSLAGLGIDVRRAVVGELTAAGMSTRAIAPVVGVSDRMVRKDVTANRSGGNRVPTSPEPADDIHDAEIVEDEPEPEPAPITGRDGKTYKRPEPVAPKRKPLTDSARDAGWDLRKAAERLQRIADDDRFDGHKEQVAPHLRSHLTNAIEVCQDLLARINN